MPIRITLATLALAAVSPAASATSTVPLPEPGTSALIAGSIAAAVIIGRFWRRK